MKCEIIREKDFDKQIQQITKTTNRMDELDNAIDWALSRNPLLFTAISGKYYIWKTEFIGLKFPVVRILYKYDPSIQTVTLIKIEVV